MIQDIIVMFGILFTLLFAIPASALHLIHYPSMQIFGPFQTLHVNGISRDMQ